MVRRRQSASRSDSFVGFLFESAKCNECDTSASRINEEEQPPGKLHTDVKQDCL